VNALEAVADALRTPLSMPALQIRVGTFALRDPKEQRIQLLIHADVGADYETGREVTLGYVIADSKGKIVVNKMGTGRLPVAAGPPSPLSFSETAIVDPGDYTLKFAIADGDRIGSVEHVVRASLIDAGAFKLSELMIGGPLDGRSVLTPTVGHDIRFGTVQGYIEAYGPNAGLLTMRYEIATGLEAPAIVSADVPGRPEGEDRAVFSYSMSVADLKPGEYFLRASLSSGGSVARRVVRAFRVAPAPPPASTSIGSAATKSVALDVRPEYLAPRFRRETLSRRDTLQRFRGTLPAGATAAFDEGTTALVLGDDAKAEAAFRKSLETGLAGADSTAPLAYLGLTFAAAGKDQEAVGIWQAALVDGASFPQLYEWMADALLRLGDMDAARPLLAEAVNKWPAETGFAKTLAFVFAKDGRAREAVALLERYITDHPEDLPAMYSGLQWMYQVHQAGLAVRSKPEDVKVASAWTDAYTLANGPDSDTVKRWMLAMEK
jgi:tetratricopeptide (TPR) repeat protein